VTLTPLDLFLRSCFAGFSILLFAVSLIAWRRHREARLAIVSLAFGIFSVVSLGVLSSTFMEWHDLEMSPVLVVLNLAILVALYIALLKR
jgi:peptidoglycan/LPS O-acetylase OafA/YrhL